jgi:hypothetical protein
VFIPVFGVLVLLPVLVLVFGIREAILTIIVDTSSSLSPVEEADEESSSHHDPKPESLTFRFSFVVVDVEPLVEKENDDDGSSTSELGQSYNGKDDEETCRSGKDVVVGLQGISDDSEGGDGDDDED